MSIKTVKQVIIALTLHTDSHQYKLTIRAPRYNLGGDRQSNCHPYKYHNKNCKETLNCI